MKSKVKKPVKSSKQIHEDILHSMVASFKIEGIHVSSESAIATLEKIKPTLGK